MPCFTRCPSQSRIECTADWQNLRLLRRIPRRLAVIEPAETYVYDGVYALHETRPVGGAKGHVRYAAARQKTQKSKKECSENLFRDNVKV